MWWFFTKKRPDRFNIAAALVCIIGMALVSLDGGLSLGLGDALTICCGFFYALHIILTARAVEGRSRCCSPWCSSPWRRSGAG